MTDDVEYDILLVPPDPDVLSDEEERNYGDLTSLTLPEDVPGQLKKFHVIPTMVFRNGRTVMMSHILIISDLQNELEVKILMHLCGEKHLLCITTFEVTDAIQSR